MSILTAIAAFRNRVATMMNNPATGNYHEQECNHSTANILSATANASATINGSDQTNTNTRGVILNCITSALAGGVTPNVVYKVQGKDAVGNYYDIPGAVTAAITGADQRQLVVYPDGVATANAFVLWPLPPIWRVVAVQTGGASLTAQVHSSELVV